MSVIGARHSLRYFLRKRFALAIARRCHGANTEVSVARPLLEMTFEADIAAAAAFSLSILWYSAGEHLFLRYQQRPARHVSKDASSVSAIMIGSVNVFRRLRCLATSKPPPRQNSACS
jgi:hypothetical protein